MTGFFACLSKSWPCEIEHGGFCTECVRHGDVTLLMQGITSGKSAQELLKDYIETGDMPLANLDGNFILVLVDSVQKKALLYRHLVGSYPVYYTTTAENFCFGSNLATVARRSGQTLNPNEATLPALFLFRMIPGPLTLFENIWELMPGEAVTWSDGQLAKHQVRTMKSLDEPYKTDEAESIERVETMLEEILRDCRRRHPRSAILLSGGVDSMILQVHWNRIWRQENSLQKPPSVAVELDHPSTQPDFDYTMSAVELLQTEHLNVRQSALTPEFMAEVISQTGEMPHHVQSLYFATLARGMKNAGFDAGITGLGADGLFGNDGPEEILAARRWKRRIPSSLLRYACACGAEFLKPQCYTASALRLSNHLDDLEYRWHPQNTAATFTDFDLVQKIFGSEEMRGAFRYRRSILDGVGVVDDPLHRAMLMGFFGSGMKTANIWTSLFHLHDVDMLQPFFDSRLLRAAANIRPENLFVPGNPKQILKNALAKHVPEAFIKRPKLGFGQPVFSWLSPGGELRQAAERIGDYAWLPKKTKQEILNSPGWPLWTLLCYDLWFKAFF